jgi:hypothetical protein
MFRLDFIWERRRGREEGGEKKGERRGGKSRGIVGEKNKWSRNAQGYMPEFTNEE